MDETKNEEVAAEEVAETTEDAAVDETIDEEKEALKKRLSQAEYVIEKLKKEKPKEASTSTPDELESRIIGKVRESMASDFLEETLARISDPIKREAVKHEYETSIVKTGVSRANIESDIAKAARLVDAELNAKVASETREALRAKSTKVNGGGSASRESTAVAEDWKRWLKPQELAYMTERKWSPEMMKRAALDIKAQKEH